MNPESSSEIDLRSFGRSLRRRKWLIVGLAFGLAVLVYLYSTTRPNMYRAASEVRVAGDTSLNLLGGTSRNDTSREIATALYLIESPAVRTEVYKQLGKDRLLVKDVSATSVEGTDVVRIEVTSPDPEVAAEAANVYAETYVSQRQDAISRAFLDQAEDLRTAANQINASITEIDAQLATGPAPAVSDVLQAQRSGFVQQQNDFIQRATEFEVEAGLRSENIQVVQEAFPPTEPFAPTPRRDALLAGFVGLVLGIIVAFLLDWLDNKVRSPADVEMLVGVPTLGVVPFEGRHMSWWRRRQAFVKKNPHLINASSIDSEAYRSLQTSLRFATMGKAKHRIAITSSVGSEGKTTVCANLAKVLAESGLRVMVISADLRKPMIGQVLGADDSGPGLSSVLLGEAQLSDCFLRIELESGRRIGLLPAGPPIQNPVALLQSPQFGDLLTSIEDAGADFVLIDCAPLLPVSDTLAITEHVDGVVVMAVAGRTRKSNLVATVERLRNVGAEVVGVILNGVPVGKGYGGYGYGGYGYGYGGYGYGGYVSDERAPLADGGKGSLPAGSASGGPSDAPVPAAPGSAGDRTA
jgi:capsular exopolysaccharide synthesis family protein